MSTRLSATALFWAVWLVLPILVFTAPANTPIAQTGTSQND